MDGLAHGFRLTNFFGPRVYPRLTNPYIRHWDRTIFVLSLYLPLIFLSDNCTRRFHFWLPGYLRTFIVALHCCNESYKFSSIQEAIFLNDFPSVSFILVKVSNTSSFLNNNFGSLPVLSNSDGILFSSKASSEIPTK